MVSCDTESFESCDVVLRVLVWLKSSLCLPSLLSQVEVYTYCRCVSTWVMDAHLMPCGAGFSTAEAPPLAVCNVLLLLYCTEMHHVRGAGDKSPYYYVLHFCF